MRLHRTPPTFSAAVAAACLALWLASAHALYDPDREYVESPAVAARYPDPQVDIPTPAFQPGKTDFTSQEELMAFVKALAARASDLRVRQDAFLPVYRCRRGSTQRRLCGKAGRSAS